MSERQARKYIAELLKKKYIARTRANRHESNRYEFLWRREFAQFERERDGSPALERKDRTAPERNNASLEENQEENHSREKTDLDYLPTNRKNRGSQADVVAGDSQNEDHGLETLVQEMLGEKPRRSDLERIISATPGKAQAQALEAILEAKPRAKGRTSPRSVSWFLSTVRNYWHDCNRRALPPAAPSFGLSPGEAGRIADEAFGSAEDTK